MEKKLRRFYFMLTVLILAAAAVYGRWYFTTAKAGSEDVPAAALSNAHLTNDDTEEMVYASGIPIGIYIKTKGILVLGTQQIEGENNRVVSPSENKLESGDYILAFNHQSVSSKMEFLSMLQKNEEKEIVLTIRRKGEKQEIKLQPVFSEEDQCYQIGAWIRNDTQGVGTVTYIRKDGSFAALGHSVNDGDLGVRLSIAGGKVYQTRISAIIKGEKDHPGEIVGAIDYVPANYLGHIQKNTAYGIFGTLERKRSFYQSENLLPVAKKSEIQEGEAYLRTSIGGKSKDYTIKIEKISLYKKNDMKSLRIKVTDPELLALTGGIVQGLSGSPILQNGKLIGAVTHVFVEDPQKGYAVPAETMLDKEK